MNHAAHVPTADQIMRTVFLIVIVHSQYVLAPIMLPLALIQTDIAKPKGFCMRCPV